MQNSISCPIYKVERVHHMGYLFILWMETEPIVTNNNNTGVLRIWTKSTHYQVSRGKDVIKSPLWKDADTFPKPFFSPIQPRVSIEWDHFIIRLIQKFSSNQSVKLTTHMLAFTLFV